MRVPFAGDASRADRALDEGIPDAPRDGWVTRARQKLLRLRELFGADGAGGYEVPYDWFSPTEVAAFFRASHPGESDEAIDDQTYSDLHASDYARLLLQERSIFARQYFEERLRGGAPPEEAQAFAQGFMQLAGDTAALAEIRARLKPLLRARHDVASMLFQEHGTSLPQTFARLRYVDWMGVCALTLVAVWPTPLSVLAVLAFLAYSLVVQVRWYHVLKQWTTQRDALRHLVRVASDICSVRAVLPPGLSDPVLCDASRLERAAKAVEPGMLSKMSASAEYANLLFLYEYARAHTECESLRGVLPLLKEVFVAVARLELQLALADATRSGLEVCRPRASDDTGITFKGLFHPLVARPAALDVQTNRRSVFISGKNGVGKSTLLRAAGLSLATFRAFGFAHAEDAALPRVAVWSSMQTADSIQHGKSLYMSELERASRLLQAARSAAPVVFLVDELFRGTNYLESVSASTSALHALAERNTVLATSHNIVLATLLRGHFDAARLVGGPEEPLRLEAGAIEATNGVELMKSYAFDSKIVTRAEAISHWYSDYIAHPEMVPNVFER